MTSSAFRGACQIGPILGHDGDECRVNNCSSGRYDCVTCGRCYPHLSAETVNTVKALLQAHPRFPYCGAPQVNDLGLSLSFDQYGFERASIVWYTQHDLVGRSFNPAEFGQFPASLVTAAQNLEKIGFRVVAPNFSDGNEDWFARAQRTVTLVLGNNPVPGKPAVLGLKVELTYVIGESRP
jgi:hypothetical protein